MASEKTLQRRSILESAEKNFEKNQEIYEKECFDTSSIYFLKMQNILDSVKNRELVHEAGYELHHKIPRSFFNKKGIPVVDKNNLYKLTYAQHFMVHYYAYLCATKFMKSAMSLALLDMKKMCTKVDGCTEENAIQLSKLFDNVKKEVYYSSKKSCKEMSLKFWKVKWDKYGYWVEDIKRLENTVQVFLICKSCGMPSYFNHTVGQKISFYKCQNSFCAK